MRPGGTALFMGMAIGRVFAAGAGADDLDLTGREDSFGGYDLYVSTPDGKGGWSEPINLGEGVNTAGSEFRPSVTADGKYLFFTSPDPDSGGHGRIYWVITEVIRKSLGAD